MKIRLYKSEEFFKFFNKEISFVDTRSISMRIMNGKGVVVGIRLDEVELCVNNNITKWYPLNNTNIIYNID